MKTNILYSYITILVFSCVNNPLIAQPQLDWVKPFGYNVSSGVQSLGSDSQNNIIIGGYTDHIFGAHLDFDFGPGVNQPGGDFFVAKYTVDAELLWVNVLRGGAMAAFSLTTDVDDNIIIAAQDWSTAIDLDPGPNTDSVYALNGEDIILTKYDSDGNYLWGYKLGAPLHNEWGLDVVTDELGNIYMVGGYMNKMDFAPGVDTFYLEFPNYTTGYIAKYTPNGELIWANSIEGPNPSSPVTTKSWSVDIDGAGNVYVFGQKGPAMFVEKYNSQGNLIWDFTLPNTGSLSGAYEMKCAFNGNFVIAGQFGATPVDFNPLGGAVLYPQNRDIFLAMYDSAGSYLWANKFGGPESDGRCHVYMDSHGNPYLTGEYRGTVDFDPGNGVFNLTSNGLKDLFLAKYDTLGDFIWAFSIGGNEGAEHPNELCLDNDDNIILCGDFYGMDVDFDPTLNTYPLNSYTINNQMYVDIFLARYMQSQIVPVSINQSENSALKIYNDDGYIYVKSSGKTLHNVQVEVYNSYGQIIIAEECDVIEGVLLKLRIPNISPGVYMISVLSEEGTTTKKLFLN